MYEDAIVTFFDVLGFKERVQTRPPEEIAEVLDTLAYVANEEVDEPVAPQIVSFSDSVVRVHRLEHELNKAFPIGLLFWELLGLLYVQANLVHRGIFVRGALTVGPIHLQEGRVFGPSLVEAYELESRFAQSPRLLVSPNALRSIETNPLIPSYDGGVEHDKGYIRNLLSKGSDGFWFLDYLSAFERELDDPAEYMNFLIVHRNLILERIKNINPISSLAAKYAWLASYHNTTIDALSAEWLEAHDCFPQQLRISQTDFPLLFEF